MHTTRDAERLEALELAVRDALTAARIYERSMRIVEVLAGNPHETEDPEDAPLVANAKALLGKVGLLREQAKWPAGAARGHEPLWRLTDGQEQV
jgi:hypothetical protein